MEERHKDEQSDNEIPPVLEVDYHADDGSDDDGFRAEDFGVYFNRLVVAVDQVQDPIDDVRILIDGVALTRLQKKRFKVIATLIPPYTPYDWGSIRRGAGAFTIATIVSVTGLKVAGRYAGLWATTFGWSGGFLVVLSAGSNIFANIFVRSTRVIWANNRLRIMMRRWDDNRMPLPDDNFIKNTIIAQGVVSFVAALPWVFLAYQNAPQEWLPWLGWVTVVCSLTLIVEGSLALCSLTDYFDFDHQRKEAVYQWKRKMLIELRSLMSAEIRALYTMEMLDCAAHGQVYRVDKESREFRENVGRVMALLASPYSAIVGYGIYISALSFFGTTTGPCQFEWVLNGGFVNTLLNMGTTTITFISGATRFFLLSVANTRLFNRVLAARDEPLFNIGGYQIVRPLIENERMQNIFNVSNYIWIFACLLIGFFSVGTAGGLSLKNIFCEMATFYSLIITLFIALGGAFSVNTESVYATLKTLMIEFIRYLITRPDTYNTGERFGQDMDEFCLIASHNVASMDEDTVETNHLNTYDTGFTGEASVATARGLTQAQILALDVNRKVGIYPSRSDNLRTQHLQAAAQGIQRTGQARFFPEWRATQNVNRHGHPIVEELPDDQEVEQEGVQLEPIITRIDSFVADDHEEFDRGPLEDDDKEEHAPRAVANAELQAHFLNTGSGDEDQENDFGNVFAEDDDDHPTDRLVFADDLYRRDNQGAFGDDDLEGNNNNAFPYQKMN